MRFFKIYGKLKHGMFLIFAWVQSSIKVCNDLKQLPGVVVLWEGSCFGFFRPKITPAVINTDCRILFWEDFCPAINFLL